MSDEYDSLPKKRNRGDTGTTQGVVTLTNQIGIAPVEGTVYKLNDVFTGLFFSGYNLSRYPPIHLGE